MAPTGPSAWYASGMPVSSPSTAVSRGPSPAEVHGILRRHLITDGLDLVLDLEGSHGAWMRCARTGRDFLDCFSYFATNPIGHNHPGVTDPAFVERLGRVAVHNPSNSDFYTVEMARFVDTFSRVAIPETLPHTFFVAGGAVAVGNALKTAFDWKVRKNLDAGKGERGSQIIHFRQAFHGRTGYALSVTNTEPMKVAYFPKFDWPRIENPYIRFPEAERLAETEAAEARAIAEIEAALAANPDDVAALIIEPIQGEGGDLHFRGEFLGALRRLADEHEFMLIFDEVQTGVGMTGRMWCHQHFGVEPDILVFGKKTQVCGILASRRMDEVENNVFRLPSRINSTFGGNLVDMVRFGRYLEIIEEEGLVENAARVGQVILDGLHELAGKAGGRMTSVRGRGLMCAFDLPDTEERDAFLARAYENRLLILGCGPRSVRVRPNLSLTEEEAGTVLSLIGRSLG